MPSSQSFCLLSRRLTLLGTGLQPLASSRVLVIHSSVVQRRNRHDGLKSTYSMQQNLVDSLYQNYNWVNQQYERSFGIAEIRLIQEKVLAAESEFVDITAKRKSYQDQLDTLKDKVKSIRDKLESTPRQSDAYLELITQEHKLLREQLTLDVQLSQLKEREQFSLDNLSKLLRQSHELERLRQERSKYWQIISISLSLVGSLIALIAQRARSQRFIERELANQRENFNLQLATMNDTIEANMTNNFEKMIARIDRIETRIGVLAESIDRNHEAEPKRPQSWSWFGWLPNLGGVRSLYGYLVG